MIAGLVAALILAPSAIGYSTSTVMQFASSTAIEYGLNKDHFLATLNCESGFAFDAVGDDGASLGVAQIDLKYHPEVLYAQAMDPYWAIVWMAIAWKSDRYKQWSCWDQLYGSTIVRGKD